MNLVWIPVPTFSLLLHAVSLRRHARARKVHRLWHAVGKMLPKRRSPSPVTWADTWWGYLDLNQGPLPYQGVGSAV